MATTEVHVLIMRPVYIIEPVVLVFTGWTPEAARQAFLDDQRESQLDPMPYATWHEWLEAEGDQWDWREETHHLPA